ncbi:hypothetical protein PsorP6_008970 [Peronosclerospora sorghi]|uniref:Uncharacterized protein n=1 Tax=Peronosclerospora sorghi TaxID=230839 RepID=A0ACC0W233_9STRA|nr:hypothetical protein PsorP6_008970 [Peronosclerospora sorghi]
MQFSDAVRAKIGRRNPMTASEFMERMVVTCNDTTPLLSLSPALGKAAVYSCDVTQEFDVETNGPEIKAEFHWVAAFISFCRLFESKCAVPVTLLMSAIGVGTLAVPYTFVLLSSVQAVVVLGCVGLAMGFTADILVDVHVSVATDSASDPQQSQETTYQYLARRSCGKSFARLTGALTAFAVFGACVGCLRVVKDMAPMMLSAMDAGFESRTVIEQQHAIMLAVWMVVLIVLLPLGCLTKISALRFSSYLGVAFSVYLIGAVTYRAVFGGGVNDRAQVSATSAKTETLLFWRVSEVVGVYNFIFMIHLNVVPLLAQVVTAEKERQKNCYRDLEQIVSEETFVLVHVLQSARLTMRRHLTLVIGACILLYAIFGLSTAQIYGNRTQGNILLNLSNDQIMAVPRVTILLTILFSFPLLLHPLRSLVLEVVMVRTSQIVDKALDDEVGQTREPSQAVHAAVTVLLVIAQILCAFRVPGLQVVFSFVGASVLLMLCYVFPLIFYVQLAPRRPSRKRLILLSALTFTAVIFCAAATLQLILSA